MSCNAFAYISVFVFSSCKEKTPTRVLNGKNIEKSGKSLDTVGQYDVIKNNKIFRMKMCLSIIKMIE